MNEFIVAFLSICLGVVDGPSSNYYPVKDNKDYRAAKYSIPIDYSTAHNLLYAEFGIVHDRLPHRIKAYRYFIQYGKNVVIDILDPGSEMEIQGVFFNKWDYSTRKFTLVHYLNHVQKYRTKSDTILFSIDSCRGSLSSLCKENATNSLCDSVGFVLDSENTDYKIYFKDRIPNLTTHKLFYPDIEYLPFKIVVSNATENNILSLEEVFQGKEAVDSLLQLFDFSNYDLITNEEMKTRDQPPIINLFKKYEIEKGLRD